MRGSLDFFVLQSVYQRLHVSGARSMHDQAAQIARSLVLMSLDAVFDAAKRPLELATISSGLMKGVRQK